MIEVYCDGGSRGNPGPSAYGFVIIDRGTIVKKGFGYLGIATNNFAEYTALVAGLVWLSSYCRGSDLQVYLDSKLIVSQLNGIYKVKNSTIRECVFKIRELESNFGNISYHHINRDKNREADKLVNQVLDKKIYGT